MNWILEKVEADEPYRYIIDELDDLGNSIIRRRAQSEMFALCIAKNLVLEGRRVEIYLDLWASVNRE